MINFLEIPENTTIKFDINYLGSHLTHNEAINYVCYYGGVANIKLQRSVIEYANMDDKFIEKLENLDLLFINNVYFIKRIKNENN